MVGMRDMTDSAGWRDYSLTGADAGPGFTPGEWYSTPVPRRRMKELMRRSDRRGLIDYGIWLALLSGCGAWLVTAWDSWWAVPAAVFYGIFYGSCADSRWHECAHGTVFKSRRLNELFYHLASFMALKNPYLWRWSHTRHHTDTIIVGRDPEIAYPRPPSLWGIIANLLYLKTGMHELSRMLRLAAGSLSDDQKEFLIESERPKAFLTSRIHLAIHLTIVGLAIGLGSWLPVMLVGLPYFYGSWLHHVLATTQHAGLAEDVPDHRLNSRTVHLNPFFRFVYSNMNYHVEHHMFPMVPFHALPALHEEIKADCPRAYPGVIAAYREILPALWRQQRDPHYHVRRLLPEGANPTPNHLRPIMAAPAMIAAE